MTLLSLIYVGLTLAADLANAWLDPRIRRRGRIMSRRRRDSSFCDLTTASSGALLRRRILAHRGLLIGAALLALIVLMALLAPLIAPHDPYAQDLSRRMIPPIWYEKGIWAHPFGTDNLGRDYLSRLLYGARISLLIGVAVMVISGLIGTALGLAAGYLRRPRRHGRDVHHHGAAGAAADPGGARGRRDGRRLALDRHRWCSACSNGTASPS